MIRFRQRISLMTAAALALIACVQSFAANTKNILITGYWPPTNEIVRPFSTNNVLNPDGWIGENWENRGYNIYSYFPTFSNPNCTSCGAGMGDLMVDYQDTTTDFWPIVDAIKPVAIITFSRTNASLSWECENNTYNSATWVNDYIAPAQPTPTPPDAGSPAGFLRNSTLPQTAIVDAINSSGLGLNGFICFSQSAGNFVSGYIAYHGIWYQSMHASENDPSRCVAAGHIHVGSGVAWNTGHEAAKVSLRVLVDYVDSILGGPGDVNIDGVVNVADLLGVINAWGACPPQPSGCPADLNNDGAANVADMLEVINNWG